MQRKRADAPVRSASDVGPGDYVKLGSTWHPIRSNDVFGHNIHETEAWRKGNWRIETTTGRTVSGWSAMNYAKVEDMETI
jgi:hypothetical protein